MRTRRGGGNDTTEAAPLTVTSSKTPQKKQDVSSPLHSARPSLSSPTSSNGKKSISASTSPSVTRLARSNRSNVVESPTIPMELKDSHYSQTKEKDIPNEVTPTISPNERQETTNPSLRTRRHVSETAKENDVTKTNGSTVHTETKKTDLPSRSQSQRRQGIHPTESMDESNDGVIGSKSKSQTSAKEDQTNGTSTRRSNRTAARKEQSVPKPEEEKAKAPPLSSLPKNASRARTTAGAVRTATTFLRKHGPNYLDEDTLERVRGYLTGEDWKKEQVLDDDEVIEMTERLYTSAHLRARRRRIAGTGPSDEDTDVGGDTGNDDDDDDASVFAECLMEEEAHVIGHEFFSDMVSTLTTPNEQGSAVLDGKTLNWIKRAVGLRRKSNGTTVALSQGSNDNSSAQYEPSRRITTRRLGRESRADRLQKRKRGLDILALAIEELEGDLDMKFPAHKVRKSQKKARAVKEDDKAIRKKKSAPPSKDAAKKNLDNRVVKRTNHVKTKEAKLPAKARTKINGISKTVKTNCVSAKQSTKTTFCTSLRVLDRTWHRVVAQWYSHDIPPPDIFATSSETAAQFQARQVIPLHPRFIRAGIVHRLPLVHSLELNDEITPTVEVDGALALQTYNVRCHQLWNSIRGLSRRFAQFEFFYSDLDKAWYKENVVAKLLGFSEDTPLSQTEWKKMRRLRKVVPRRFSKRFIISQLKERNDYRAKVRQIQSNPSEQTNFPYNVYMPNRIGSVVTAYCKRYHLLQRGSVLAFFPENAMYLIEFDNVHFGCEYCPDSDVASCGVPTRVVPSNCAIREDSRLVSSSEQGIVWLDKLAQNPGSRSALTAATAPSTSSSLTTFVDEVANYDSFLSLLEMIDVARSRKHELLSLIEDANTLGISALPFGQSDESSGDDGTKVEPVKLPQSTNDHLQWLTKNLQRTNLVLDAAMNTFRTLYGNSFVSNGAVRSNKIDQTELKRLMKKAEAILAGS